MSKKKRKSKRGYIKTVLIGIDSMHAKFWLLFSERAQFHCTVQVGRKHENADKSDLYKFHEELVNKIRPLASQGKKSFLLVSPAKKNYSKLFLDHVKAHHHWLFLERSDRSVAFKIVEGRLNNVKEVSYFVQTDVFQEAIKAVTSKEAGKIIDILEKRLNVIDADLVLVSLADIEDFIYAGGKRKKTFKPLKVEPEYILVTTKYLEKTTGKARIQRLMQISKNRGIKSKIVDSETQAGERIDQFGGIACFLEEK
ncbi:MAG: hypothetical protein ACTSUE_18195 [Promethearchaeota archaeon]